ncbi:MAG TPA: sulfotransferase [Rhizomicrobium sp.]|nr:sulfotransferase [Rhizomicrobium sp.]
MGFRAVAALENIQRQFPGGAIWSLKRMMDLHRDLAAENGWSGTTNLSPTQDIVRDAGDQPKFPPPVFIVGPPRSGTSLLYESLVTRYRFAYFSNLADRFSFMPVPATAIGIFFVRGWRGKFESRYGHIDGWGAPSEAGRIWNRWLPRTRRNCAISVKAEKQLQTAISAFSALFDAPFINKNVMLSMHIGMLARIFENPVFIRVTRDPVENVRSILGAQDAGIGPYENGWWSVRPTLADRFENADRLTKACVQVIGIEADILADCKRHALDRLFTVDYHDMCQRPRDLLDELGTFLRDCKIELRDRLQVPASFSRRSKNGPRLSEAVIRAKLDEIARQAPLCTVSPSEQP